MSEVTQTANVNARGTSLPGEEELRFIRNFHDIFLSIGIAMFTAGLGVASFLLVAPNFENAPERADLLTIAAVSFGDAIIMWLLAEFFARKRRLFLPSIVILLGFAGFFVWGTFFGYAFLIGENMDDFGHTFDSDIEDGAVWAALPLKFRLLPFVVAMGGVVATYLFYLRSRLPFAMGWGGVWLAGAFITLLAAFDGGLIVENYKIVWLAAGIFLFVLGIAFDATDPERKTLRSDNAFWLHFFAGPAIFGSVMALVVGSRFEIGDASAAVTTLVIVVIFAFISLLINRRALLVSGLISAIIAVAVLVRQSGADAAWTAATTLLILGGAMVLLGAGWHVARRVLLAAFPKTGPIARIFPPEVGNLGE